MRRGDAMGLHQRTAIRDSVHRVSLIVRGFCIPERAMRLDELRGAARPLELAKSRPDRRAGLGGRDIELGEIGEQGADGADAACAVGGDDPRGAAFDPAGAIHLGNGGPGGPGFVMLKQRYGAAPRSPTRARSPRRSACEATPKFLCLALWLGAGENSERCLEGGRRTEGRESDPRTCEIVHSTALASLLCWVPCSGGERTPLAAGSTSCFYGPEMDP